jgi:polo-like kinase 1
MEMMKKMTRLSESEAAFIMHQILVAVQHMHENLVIHRDLKLGNLFLTENMEVKIGDFGLAAQLDYPEQRKQTLCGTPNYIAPEILRSSGHSYEVDVWSIGVIFYTLLVGTPPFETPNVKETYKNIKANNYSFPSEPRIGELSKDLIKSILVPDPSKRPTVTQILSHKFFSVHMPAIQNCPTSLSQYASLYASPSSKVPQPRTSSAPSSRVPFKSIQNIIEQQAKCSKPQSPVKTTILKLPITARTKSPPMQRFQQPQPVTQPLSYRPLGQSPMDIVQPHVPAPRLSPMPERNEHHASPMTARSSPGEIQKRDAPLFNIQQYTSNQSQSPSTGSPLLTNAKPSTPVETVARSIDDDEEHSNLTTMHDNITQSFVALSKTSARERPVEPAPKLSRTPSSASPSLRSEEPAPRGDNMVMDIEDEDGDINLENNHQPLQHTSVWVSQWADFTNKYGLAYRLNSGMTGAHFNDSSKMVWNHETGQIDYIERKKPSHNTAAFEEKQTFNIAAYPPSLQKKITLIKHFRVYLDKEQSQKRRIEEQCAGPFEKDVYVKRWLKTRHAVIFRLSNKVVQVHFQDDTEIILSSEARLVTYTDGKGERKTFPLSDLINNPQVDVSKRLKYTKDILYQLISKQSK